MYLCRLNLIINMSDMKKLFVLFTALFLMITAGFAQTENTAEQPNGPEITFKETNHDFGNVQYKGNASFEFVFVNTGNEPLILSQPKSSCGCTVPEWPKQPILPGESNCIKVTYKNTDRAGGFNKYVTIFSNALVNNEVKLHIKGTVQAQPTEEAPIKMEGIGSPINNNSNN